ncbi:unnamed protein product [Effrenium voratum]|nr:unnamed protein product [Effrenium voratum]
MLRRVLYHYTHRASFEEFVRIFASDEVVQKALADPKAAQDEEPLTVYSQVLHMIQADWTDRMPRTGARTLDPELLLHEPAKFSSRQALHEAILGLAKPAGLTNSGRRLADIGDFCVAVKAPGSVLAPVSYGIMRIERMALQTLARQGQLRKANQAKQEALERAAAERRRARGILARLCGGAEAPVLWDEEQEEEETTGRVGRVKRQKRQVDKKKEEKLKTWTKEHFIAVKDARRREIEAEDLPGQPRVRGLRGRVARLVAESRRLVQKLMGQEVDDDALALYREHMQKEAVKKSAVGALERLKSMRGTNSEKLVRSVRRQKSRTASADSMEEAEEKERGHPKDPKDLPGDAAHGEAKRTRRRRRRRRRKPEPQGEAGEEDLPELEILDSEVEQEAEEPGAAAEELRGEESDTSSSSDSSSSESGSSADSEEAKESKEREK